MVAVTKRNLAAPPGLRVSVLGSDAAWVALAMGGIGAAGGHPVAHSVAAWENVLAALRGGDLDRVVVLDSELARRFAGALGDAPSLARRVLAWSATAPTTAVSPLAAAPAEPSLDDLVRSVMGRAPTSDGPATEIDVRGVSLARLLGAAAVLRPNLELTLHSGERAAGLHLSDGLIRAIGLSDRLPRDDRQVSADPSLRLVTRHWTDRAGASPSQRLEQELSQVSRYGDIFADSQAHRDYLIATLGATLDLSWDRLEVRGASVHGRGVDLLAALRDVSLSDGSSALAELAPGDARVVAPAGLPSRLREALPANRFGRLFFLLEAPTAVQELAQTTRLTEAEVRAGVTLGLLTGAVERVGVHARPRDRAPLRTTRHERPDAMVGVSGMAVDRAPLRTARRVRPKTMVGVSGMALAQTGEAEARRIIDRLADAARRARTQGVRVRVHNTRFEPVGELTEDLLLGYRIGHGGMGDVLLAVHGSDANVQKVVAVKRRTEAALSDPERLKMFFAEARVSAGLTHPNIIQTYQLLRIGERYGLVMEFVHGVTVSELLRLRGGEPLPASLVAWIGAEVAAGLYYAHKLTGAAGDRLGLVHRDVAPQNIMLGVEGTVKLIDFGVADVSGGEERSRRRSGRAAFMAPEILAYNAAGPAADQFALAVTLYVLLTGASPFPATPESDVVEATMSGRYTPVLEVRADAPPALAYAIERGLALRTGERFADCDALRHALLGAVPHEGDERELVATVVGEAASSVMPWELEAIARMRRAASAIFGARHARRLSPEPNLDDEVKS